MVEYVLSLDEVFGSLADPTRRDILQRLRGQRLSISQVALNYDLTFAAISKHLKVLEKARLVIKHRRGKEQIVELSPQALAMADEYLRQYRDLWESRLDALEELLKQEQLKARKEGGQNG